MGLGLGLGLGLELWSGSGSGLGPNLVVAGVEELQLRQRRQWCERIDLVVLEVQGAERDGELHAISAHEVVAEAEDGERAWLGLGLGISLGFGLAKLRTAKLG